MDANVCTSCGGVAIPEGMEAPKEENCSTPGCEKNGQPLESKEVSSEDTMECPTCGGTFMKDSSHSHDEE